MRTIVTPEQAEGKTIERVETSGNYASILFTDGTALLVRAQYEFLEHYWVERYLCRQYAEAFALGLTTEAERDALRIPDEERRRAEIEKREREQLAILKAKYET